VYTIWPEYNWIIIVFINSWKMNIHWFKIESKAWLVYKSCFSAWSHHVVPTNSWKSLLQSTLHGDFQDERCGGWFHWWPPTPSFVAMKWPLNLPPQSLLEGLMKLNVTTSHTSKCFSFYISMLQSWQPLIACISQILCCHFLSSTC
jgi:hypothetical protein